MFSGLFWEFTLYILLIFSTVENTKSEGKILVIFRYKVDRDQQKEK